MLEFKKRILQKVSFDHILFEKELKKAIAWLTEAEIVDLKKWCYDYFSHRYHSILDLCFKNKLVVA